jgi:hypothetical protein
MTNVSEVNVEGSTFSIRTRLLVNTCVLFETRPGLLEAPYQVRSMVLAFSFELFISALENESIPVTKSNYSDLNALCQSSAPSALLSNYRPSPPDRWRILGFSIARGRT